MLNDVINKVAEKVGISTEQATEAVTTVVDFLKNKLPAPIASQIDTLLSGGSVSDVLGSAKEKISSFFDKK